MNNELLFSTLYAYIRRLIALSVIMNMKLKDIHIFLMHALKTFLYDFVRLYWFFYNLLFVINIDENPSVFSQNQIPFFTLYCSYNSTFRLCLALEVFWHNLFILLRHYHICFIPIYACIVKGQFSKNPRFCVTLVYPKLNLLNGVKKRSITCLSNL